jgi:hypothetical protein
MGPVDLDSAAQELYGLPLDEFVAARNGRAKAARQAGDRELAAEIQALTKPTIAAWLVNQLAREHGDDLEPLLDLGRELRDASSKLDGETMRRLGRRRNELISELVAHARRTGADHGSKVSDDVADDVRRTLEASLSDADVATDVSAGQLTRAVEYAGFGEALGLGGPQGVVGSSATRRRTSDRAKRSERPAKRSAKSTRSTAQPSRPPADLGERRRQRAEREVTEAAGRVETALSARDDAAEARERTVAEVERTEAEVQRLRTELSAAERAAKSSRHADRTAQQQVARTERELGGAERVHQRAKDRLAELED